jgi:hypothetical protein
MTGKSTFVPNSFQTPNDYVDAFMPYLTGEEYKVLIYATRRILGFQKRQDRISLSQFTDGTRSIKDGRTLDSGTGLGKETVKNCLDNLVKFGLMVKVADNDPRTNEGTLWSLQWNEDDVNWKELQNHLEKRSKVNAARMAKARSVRQTAVGETDRALPSGTDRGGVSGTGTQNPGLETQLKTGKEEMSKNPMLLWEQIQEAVKSNLKGNNRTYLAGAQPISFRDGVLTLVVRDQMTRDWLDDHLTATINRTFPGLIEREAAVQFVVETA